MTPSQPRSCIQILKCHLEVLANLFMLFWHTWNIRNKVVHEGTTPFIASSVTFLTRYMHSLLNIQQHGDLRSEGEAQFGACSL